MITFYLNQSLDSIVTPTLVVLVHVEFPSPIIDLEQFFKNKHVKSNKWKTGEQKGRFLFQQIISGPNL